MSTPRGDRGAEDIRQGTRERLLARARADAVHRGLQRRGARRGTLAMVGSLAAAAVLLVVLALQNTRLRSRVAEQQQLGRRLADSLVTVAAKRDSQLAALTGPSVRVMQLTASTAREARAFMFWNTERATWTFVAHALPPLRPGRSYQLWLVTDSLRISVGVLDVSRSGSVIVQATYPLDPATLRAVAVTEEPAGGSPQPTSAPVIAALAPREAEGGAR